VKIHAPAQADGQKSAHLPRPHLHCGEIGDTVNKIIGIIIIEQYNRYGIMTSQSEKKSVQAKKNIFKYFYNT